MARTLNEIHNSITERFISFSVIKTFYGLDETKTFAQQFLPSSLEAILFYGVATAIQMVEQQWEQYKKDLVVLLRENRAHTSQWYATRAKEFQYGYSLVAETDQYDNTNLTSELVEKAQIVKFAASMETKDQSILLLKIATLSGGNKQPIKPYELVAFSVYINAIKDAGVRVRIINEPADALRLVMDIYYNPLLIDDQGRYLDGSGDSPVQDAIDIYEIVEKEQVLLHGDTRGTVAAYAVYSDKELTGRLSMHYYTHDVQSIDSTYLAHSKCYLAISNVVFLENKIECVEKGGIINFLGLKSNIDKPLNGNKIEAIGDFKAYEVKTYRYIYPLCRHFKFKTLPKPYPEYEKGMDAIEWARDTTAIKSKITYLLTKV